MAVVTKDLKITKPLFFGLCPAYSKDLQDVTVFRAGDTFCVVALFYNDNWLPVWYVNVEWYFGREEGDLEKIYENPIILLPPYSTTSLSITHKIPEDAESGYYYVGVKTSDEKSALIKQIYVKGNVTPPPPTVARLDIVTQPVGAKIYVDGSYVGVSPVTVDVDEGYHDVKAVKKGYEVKSCSGKVVDGLCRVYAEAGKVTQVTITLEPSPTPPWTNSLYWAIGGLAIGGLLALAERRGLKWPTRSK